MYLTAWRLTERQGLYIYLPTHHPNVVAHLPLQEENVQFPHTLRCSQGNPALFDSLPVHLAHLPLPLLVFLLMCSSPPPCSCHSELSEMLTQTWHCCSLPFHHSLAPLGDMTHRALILSCANLILQASPCHLVLSSHPLPTCLAPTQLQTVLPPLTLALSAA